MVREAAATLRQTALDQREQAADRREHLADVRQAVQHGPSMYLGWDCPTNGVSGIGD
jgi:hypothetical protein